MWIGYQKNQMDQMDQIGDQKEQIGICILITKYANQTSNDPS
jgi:hypothetical protein